MTLGLKCVMTIALSSTSINDSVYPVYIYTQQEGPAIEKLFFAKHFLFAIEANDKINTFNMISKTFHAIINI